jgi:hypothetical protein
VRVEGDRATVMWYKTNITHLEPQEGQALQRVWFSTNNELIFTEVHGAHRLH